MARGPLTEESRQRKMMEQVAETLALLGGSAEEIDLIKTVELPSATENTIDKIREAESVLIYFSTNGSRFKERQCRTCGEVFAYRWELDSISNCSLDCCKKALKQIGIKWDPHRTQAERWGQYAPVVVPPTALKILKDQLNDSQEDPPPDKPL